AWEYLQNADVSAEVRRNGEQTGHFMMARIEVARGNLDSARMYYRQYAERARKLQSPSQLRATHELAGIIALAEEDYDKAVAEFKQASQRSPYTYYRLGLAYEGLGEMKEARRWYHQAATFNEVVSLSYALVRQKAADKAAATS
ncbi:hypothetical protein GF420_12190, partial [candidate division GN15 bacterium]|nr:hypothetical protein [candidate division GN15 bacterium]